ncbi:MAG: hypothetical protein EP329_07525 [Deltaproteobacteria bacterium]|nr:MAG: hypothetical protein EP329_07525 [Deltaproteobacteria bacterium]
MDASSTTRRALATALVSVWMGGCPGGTPSGGGDVVDGGHLPVVTTWVRSFGGEATDYRPRRVIETADGGFVAVGDVTFAGGGRDLWVVRLDPLGELSWSRTYGLGGGALELREVAAVTAIAPSAGGGFLVVGRGADERPTVVELDGGGNVVRTQAYASKRHLAKVIRPGADGSFLVAGVDGGFVDGRDLGANAWIMRIARDGSVLADLTMERDEDGDDNDGDALLVDVCQGAGGDLVAAGWYDPAGLDAIDGYVLRVNNVGAVLHDDFYEGGLGPTDTNVRFRSLCAAPGGGYVAVGHENEFDFGVGAGGSDIRAVGYTADLEVAWDLELDLDDLDDARVVVPSGDGGFFVGGSAGAPEQGSVPVLFKLDGQGEELWRRLYDAKDRYALPVLSITPRGPTSAAQLVLGTPWRILVVEADGAPVETIELEDAGILWAEGVLPIDEDGDGVPSDGYLVFDEDGLVRLDPAGGVVWRRDGLSGGQEEGGYDVLEAPEGGFVVAGYTAAPDGRSRDAWVLRLTEDGDLVWQRAFGGPEDDEARAIVSSHDGYVVAGRSGRAAWFAGLGRAGAEQFQTRLEGEDAYEVLDLAAGPAEQLYVAGRHGARGWVARVAPSGDPDSAWGPWQRLFELGPMLTFAAVDGEVPERELGAAQVEVDPLGGTLALFDVPDRREVVLVRMSPAGEALWTRIYPRGYSTRGNAAVRRTRDGGYVLTMPTATGGGLSCSSYWEAECPNLSLRYLDADGAPVWERVYGTAASDLPASVALTSDCGLVVAGQTDGLSYPAFDAWFLKTGGDGRVVEGCGAELTEEVEPAPKTEPLARAYALESALPTSGTGASGRSTTITPLALTQVPARSCFGSAWAFRYCDCGEPADFSGFWSKAYTCQNSCGLPDESGTEALEVRQQGTAATIVTEQGFELPGLVCGERFEWSGHTDAYLDAGTWTLNADGTVTKVSDWVSLDAPQCGGHCDGTLVATPPVE